MIFNFLMLLIVFVLAEICFRQMSRNEQAEAEQRKKKFYDGL